MVRFYFSDILIITLDLDLLNQKIMTLLIVMVKIIQILWLWSLYLTILEVFLASSSKQIFIMMT